MKISHANLNVAIGGMKYAGILGLRQIPDGCTDAQALDIISVNMLKLHNALVTSAENSAEFERQLDELLAQREAVRMFLGTM